jgi:hypothetical protein
MSSDTPSYSYTCTWKEAINVELESFNRLEVMLHRQTRMEVRARGITRRPVPLRFVLKCKRHPDGTYDKLACRTATRRAKQSNAKLNQRRGSGHVSAPRGQHNMQGDDGGADNLSCRHPLEWEGGVGLDDY